MYGIALLKEVLEIRTQMKEKGLNDAKIEQKLASDYNRFYQDKKVKINRNRSLVI